MMAIALFPLCALAGSAIDTARLYVVKVRLQQACDAGVLAGRKFIVDSSSTTLDPTATTQANNFFNNNFTTGWLGTSATRFTPTKTADQRVAGTASTIVPMTIMKMFNMQPVTLNVACEAEYDVADADVMFVLDTTGSMACLTSDNESTCDSYVVGATKSDSNGYYVTEKTGSRIDGLRDAVLDFYDTVTDEADATTHFRFGFVPYNATVNTGYLLPSGTLPNSPAQYQTRVQAADVTSGSASVVDKGNQTSTTCAGYASRTPVTGYASEAADWYYSKATPTWAGAANATPSTTANCKVSTQKWLASFDYKSATWDVSSYLTGAATTIPTFPTMAPGVTQPTARWAGCIEERSTITGSTFSTSSPPPDLDIDATPTSADPWRPLWPEVSFARSKAATENTTYPRTPVTRFQLGGNATSGTEYGGLYNEVPCPKQSSRLSSMVLSSMTTASIAAVRQKITDYVSESNNFRPYGRTYHDVGMTWGSRLLSPDGMFKADTTAWPGHKAPNRYIIFLTDGQMEPDLYAYSSHGIDYFDNRVGANQNTTTLTNYHNARFTAACTIARAKFTKVFVISYAQALTTQLTSCASPGEAYQADNGPALKTAFEKIAGQVALLRVSQ